MESFKQLGVLFEAFTDIMIKTLPIDFSVLLKEKYFEKKNFELPAVSMSWEVITNNHS